MRWCPHLLIGLWLLNPLMPQTVRASARRLSAWPRCLFFHHTRWCCSKLPRCLLPALIRPANLTGSQKHAMPENYKKPSYCSQISFIAAVCALMTFHRPRRTNSLLCWAYILSSTPILPGYLILPIIAVMSGRSKKKRQTVPQC